MLIKFPVSPGDSEGGYGFSIAIVLGVVLFVCFRQATLIQIQSSLYTTK